MMTDLTSSTISDAVENWQEMSSDECLAFLEQLEQLELDLDRAFELVLELMSKEIDNSRNDVMKALWDKAANLRHAQIQANPKANRLMKSYRELKERLQQMTNKQDKPKSDTQEDMEATKDTAKSKPVFGEFQQEALLEFMEEESGAMILREVGKSDPLVSIEFSEQVKDMLGGDVHLVAQAMIHAAISSVVQRQANFWHAHIYDEEPVHYS
ncbi:hypothetical protein [Moraxella cuniculi]|nr:hypothetical protein [Moraxella cuniculi]